MDLYRELSILVPEQADRVTFIPPRAPFRPLRGAVSFPRE
jgi:hypothetical protein